MEAIISAADTGLTGSLVGSSIPSYMGTMTGSLWMSCSCRQTSCSVSLPTGGCGGVFLLLRSARRLQDGPEREHHLSRLRPRRLGKTGQEQLLQSADQRGLQTEQRRGVQGAEGYVLFKIHQNTPRCPQCHCPSSAQQVNSFSLNQP
uniref:Uncharacterized protein n=1 Tax=Electrophorus electricus TaxID=8005 RepID=A0A4W4EEW3_ELEEL